MQDLLTVLLVAFIFVLSGCSGKTPETSASFVQPLPTVPADYAEKTIPPNADATAGANLFNTDCVTCHGEDGRGDGPAAQTLDPRPANLVDLGKISTNDFLFWKISAGADGTAMPAWKSILTDQQIWDVVAFIRTLK